jgi:hypothetical protein
MPGQICMGKMKKQEQENTEIDFIQKRRKILPNRDRRFKDESPASQ